MAAAAAKSKTNELECTTHIHTRSLAHTLFGNNNYYINPLQESRCSLFLLLSPLQSLMHLLRSTRSDMMRRAQPRESAFRFGFLLRVIDPRAWKCVCGLAMAVGNLRSIPGKSRWAPKSLTILRLYPILVNFKLGFSSPILCKCFFSKTLRALLDHSDC